MTAPRKVHRPSDGTGDDVVLCLASCPGAGCPAPAEVYGEVAHDSTHGPVPHAWTFCLNRHFYLLPAEYIPGYANAVTTRRKAADAETHNRILADGREP
jgi:hypothetical protein